MNELAVMFDCIKKEQNPVWTLLEGSISTGKGTLTADIATGSSLGDVGSEWS